MTRLAELTERQREVLMFVVAFIKRERMPPTYRNIAERFGVNVAAVQCHVKALARKGYLEVLPHTARGIRVVR